MFVSRGTCSNKAYYCNWQFFKLVFFIRTFW